MTEVGAGLEDWNRAWRQFGSASVELRVPARVPWKGTLQAECRVEAQGKPVNLPFMRFTTLIRSQDSDGTNWAHCMDHLDRRVRLAAGEQMVIPVEADVPRRPGTQPEGQVSLFASGAWSWPPSFMLTVPFQLVMFSPYDELASHVAACSGFTEIKWGVPWEYGAQGDFAAMLTPAGGRHPLLYDLRLEVMDVPGEIRGCLEVGERFQGPGSFILGPDRKRHAFAFAAGELEQAKRFLEETVRPYDPEHRKLPIPGRELYSDAHLKLPLPASHAKGEVEDLPVPSQDPDGT